jgi:hypothetical protein
MSHEQFLHTAHRRAEAEGNRRRPLPVPPLALLSEYFTDPWRPRLAGNAFLVWLYLLFKAEPESRIATVSNWDIKVQTGIRSNRGLGQALDELRRYGYCSTWDLPTAPYYPRNYKIPEHIGSAELPEAQAIQLHRQAEQARKRRSTPPSALSARSEGRLSTGGRPKREPEPDYYAGVDLKAFAQPAATNESGPILPLVAHQPAAAPGGSPDEPAKDPKVNPSVALAGPILPPVAHRAKLDLKDLESLNLDQEIERLEKEVEEIGKALSKETGEAQS